MYDAPLRLQNLIDNNTQEEIEESIRGVEYTFIYTGKRQAPQSKMIEIHITSTIVDWNQQQYVRKAWYMGHSSGWKNCIEMHIRQHLLDMSTGMQLVIRMMQDFEIKEENFVKWEKYYSNGFRRLYHYDF